MIPRTDVGRPPQTRIVAQVPPGRGGARAPFASKADDELLYHVRAGAVRINGREFELSSKEGALATAQRFVERPDSESDSDDSEEYDTEEDERDEEAEAEAELEAL